MQGQHIEVHLPASSSAAELFNASSLALIGELHLRFEPQLQHLLEARSDRQSALDSGAWPTSLPSGDEQEWEVPRIPQDLRDRRVELHCDANDSKFVQAFETAASTLLVDLAELLPVPAGALLAQRTLRDTLRDRTGADGKTVVFGPRNLGAHETMLSWGTNAAHAALVDIALYLQNNAVISEVLGLRLGQLESVAEAELWRDIFGFLEAKGVVSPGQIKATLAVESVPALFDIDSIMRALGNYTVALGLDHHACMGSFVRSFRCYPQFILPDRNELTDDVHFLRSWNILLVQHAHRHGASAISSCARSIASAAEDDNRTFTRLRSLMERHVHAGFDGGGVSDMQLIAPAREAFDRLMPGQHQQHRLRNDTHISAADLLQVPKGKITESGMRLNLEIVLRGLIAVENGETSLTIRHCRETPASIEFAALQLRHWVRHVTGVLDDGRIIDRSYFNRLLADVARDCTGSASLPDGPIKVLSDHVLGSAEPAGIFRT